VYVWIRTARSLNRIHHALDDCAVHMGRTAVLLSHVGFDQADGSKIGVSSFLLDLSAQAAEGKRECKGSSLSILGGGILGR